MTKTRRALAVLLLLALATFASGAAANAAAFKPGDIGRKFGLQATDLAKAGKCKNVRQKSNGGQFAYSGLVCDLRGERINILTYENKREELKWLKLACTGLPEQWLTLGYGFVITARDGAEEAARVGKRVYGGKVRLCSDLVPSRPVLS